MADFVKARLLKMRKINSLEVRKAERYRGFIEGYKVARSAMQNLQPPVIEVSKAQGMGTGATSYAEKVRASAALKRKVVFGLAYSGLHTETTKEAN